MAHELDCYTSSSAIVIPSAARELHLKEHRYYVYIMASRSLTLYTGITGDIYNRVLDHKEGRVEGFTERYNINRLVYFETFQYVNNAIAREKQIKAWTRAKRIALIKSTNPTWLDLAADWSKKIEIRIPRSARDDKHFVSDVIPVHPAALKTSKLRHSREKEL